MPHTPHLTIALLNKGFFEIEYQKIEINEKIGLGNLTVRRSHIQ